MSNRTPPVIAMVVQNDVSGDTRVKKTALTLAHAGCSVTVYGFAKDGRRWETSLGPVRIVRLVDPRRAAGPPSPFADVRRLAAHRSPEALRRAVARRAVRRARVVAVVGGFKARIDAREQRISGRGARSLSDRLLIASLWYRIKAVRGAANIAEIGYQLRLSITRGDRVARKLWRKARRHIAGRRRTAIPGAVRNPLAHLERLERVFVQELQGHQIDAIHAHDFFTIAMAHRAAQRLSEDGAPVRWVYDAHEYVRGLDFFSAERRAAALAIEGDHIRAADRVVTVTPDLADRLQEDYALPRRPDVVLNAPARMGSAPPRETVRSCLGLADDVPLLVYAGQVKAPRDIHTLVAALEYLPDAHLAVLTANEGPYVERLADIAARISATDRYHRLPYVASHEVSAFLSDATVGVVPLTHYGNAEVALPTKLFEFLHARLPMVVSDTRAMRRFVEELGVGEVFVAGDAHALATAVLRVLERPDTYRQPLRSHPELLVRYSWQEQERVLLDVYSSVLDRPLRSEGRTPTSLREHAVSRVEREG